MWVNNLNFMYIPSWHYGVYIKLLSGEIILCALLCHTFYFQGLLHWDIIAFLWGIRKQPEQAMPSVLILWGPGPLTIDGRQWILNWDIGYGFLWSHLWIEWRYGYSLDSTNLSHPTVTEDKDMESCTFSLVILHIKLNV